MSKDPITFGGGTSFYGYAEGDPIDLVDPNGLETCKQCDIKKYNEVYLPCFTRVWGRR